jgi:integrase
VAALPQTGSRLHRAHPNGIVRYTAHELRHVCASLLIASGASDVQVAHQMGHSKIETTKNIYGHLFAQDLPRSLTP